MLVSGVPLDWCVGLCLRRGVFMLCCVVLFSMVCFCCVWYVKSFEIVDFCRVEISWVSFILLSGCWFVVWVLLL